MEKKTRTKIPEANADSIFVPTKQSLLNLGTVCVNCRKDLQLSVLYKPY